VIDAGMMDSGVIITPDAGPDDAGVVEPDAGMNEEDAGVIRQPVLAFQGGGCSAAPVIAPLLCLFLLRRRRRD
jgi:hypothetical protein